MDGKAAVPATSTDPAGEDLLDVAGGEARPAGVAEESIGEAQSSGMHSGGGREVATVGVQGSHEDRMPGLLALGILGRRLVLESLVVP